MWRCTKFLALRAKERQSVIKKFKLCFHCLGSGHRVDQINFDDLESGSDNSDEVPEQSETFHTDVFGVARDGAISLQTLVCDIRTKSGTKQVVVLLDSGSNSTLIDQALASKLKAEVVDGPIVRKVNYVDRQVEVKSDLVSFELVNPNNNADCHDLMRSLETISSKKQDHPWAVKTPLGWTYFGPSEPRFPGDVTKAEVHSMIIND